MARKHNVSDYQRLNRPTYGRPKRKTSPLTKAIIILVLLAVGVVAYFGYKAYKAYKSPIGRNAETVYLYVTDTADMEKLQQQINLKIAPNYPSLLKYAERFHRLDKNLKLGRYAIKPEMTTVQVVEKLASGQQDSVIFNIGYLRTEQELIDYLSQSLWFKKDSLTALFQNQQFLKELGETRESLRGEFLQGRYAVLWTTSPRDLIKTFHKSYTEFWTKERLAKLDKLGITKQEAIALASIVEAESGKEDEYSRIAGLYLNRHRKGYKLQSDPTVKFASKDFELRRILKKHLAIESPYNTYKVAGIPPGPIHTPKPSTIDYVLNAEKHKFIYMCAKEDFSGRHNFAARYSDHLQNAQKYQRALDKRGIK